MQTSISNIQVELDKAKERLKGVEDTIKKSIGRDVIGANQGPRSVFKRNARHLGGDADGVPPKEFKKEGVKHRLGDFVSRNDGSPFNRRNNARPRMLDGPRNRKVELKEERLPAKKRLGEQTTVTVFSRLSGPPKDEPEEKEPEKVVKITSQVIAADAPSRKDILAAQSGDNQCRARNKRMFGALLGTLQKFRQEECQLKEKEEKRAQVEKKLEEAAAREKEELKKKRQELFSTRRQQQIEIRQLEFKLSKMKQLKEWEATKLPLQNYIKTDASPKLYYLPKVHNHKTEDLLAASKASLMKMIESKRADVERMIASHDPKTHQNEEKEEETMADDIKEGDDHVEEEPIEDKENLELTDQTNINMEPQEDDEEEDSNLPPDDRPLEETIDDSSSMT